MRLREPGWISLAFAVVLLVVVPLVPGALAAGSPAALIGLPAESVAALLLLCLLPWRLARIVAAVGFGIMIVVALVLAVVDAGYRAVLDIPFDPLDWQQLGDAFGVLQASVGAATAIGVVVLVSVVAVGAIVALTWAVLRVAAAVAPHRGHAPIAIATLTTAWTIVALTGWQVMVGHPAAATASVQALGTSASRAAAGLTAQADLQQKIDTDRYRETPGADLLTALTGKDVIFAFVESYGRVAVQGSEFSEGVRQVLRDGDVQLHADGYSSRSAFLTSPTFGGLSWLAHSTLQTGLWVDRQPLYSKVIRSDRFTLSDAFARAGWRTVSDVPSDTEAWSFGSSFYHFDSHLDANNVGYRGPAFGYARIPDQYTWKYFADHELTGDHRPVMAEIDLVSSHTPWAPLPQLVPWAQVGDGSVFGPQPAQGESASFVWERPERVQQAYARSIRYALGATFAFLHEADDPNLVLVVLGDHQPATIVSGQGAGHDVPISIISKDPSVFASIDGWRWPEGLLPDPDAPVWPMSDFRDRFLDAFDAR